MSATVASVWEDLEREAAQGEAKATRLYRAIGASAIGIRASYLPNDGILELLIEVPDDWSAESVIPEWRGMKHEILPLSLPPRGAAKHLRIYLVTPEHRDIFLIVCEDLVTELEGIADAELRVGQIETCLLRWRLFFERSGLDGLSKAAQQGLFAELTWMQRLLEQEIDPLRVLQAWKGCTRGYHDFDIGGHVVEVKSTRTKEPRSVTINNERQLDDSGLNSLHLYVLSVHEVDGGATLPELVTQVRTMLNESPPTLSAFRNCLVSAGYVDIDAKRYTQRLIIKFEDLYRVTEGFPRITAIPAGLGGLRYHVVVGACESFRTELSQYLSDLAMISNE